MAITPNTVAGGAMAVGAIWDFADKAVGAWSTYYGKAANANMQKIGARMTRWGAKAHLDDAGRAYEYAGAVQQSGEEAGVNRYLRLGQDIGRIYAGAAAGNIDVSSGVVRNVESAARLMAGRDVAAQNRSTRQEADRYVDEAKNARLAYISDMTAAKLQDIQASYNKKIARSQMRNSIWNSAGQMAAGAALGMMML